MLPTFEILELKNGEKIRYTYNLSSGRMIVTAGYDKLSMKERSEFIEKLRAERDVVKIYFNGNLLLK